LRARGLAIAAAAALLGACALSAGATPQAQPQLVFLLAGQSNMVGRAFPLSAGERPDPRVQMWRENKGWVTAVDPLNEIQAKTAGVGLGLTFGLTVMRATGKRVGLINCSEGGTSIQEWLPADRLFQQCLAMASHAKLPVAGVLFLQGEKDAEDATLAAEWEQGFGPVLAGFRTLSKVFLLGQIGTLSIPPYAYQATVRTQQAHAAATSKVPLVVSKDLPMAADGEHYTVPGYKVLGRRFAAAYLRPLTRPKH
jgi:hypothetical protein